MEARHTRVQTGGQESGREVFEVDLKLEKILRQNFPNPVGRGRGTLGPYATNPVSVEYVLEQVSRKLDLVASTFFAGLKPV